MQTEKNNYLGLTYWLIAWRTWNICNLHWSGNTVSSSEICKCSHKQAVPSVYCVNTYDSTVHTRTKKLQWMN